ncbi:MAG: hypothetical protein F6K24_29640 [Okeania sp. SIO2D1]|nr:hypothetical protein [Okeania sp. SIO2D1]
MSFFALLNSVYDISLNYLGANPAPNPSQEGNDRVRRKERGIEEESFLVAERGTEFYRTPIGI